MSNNTPCWNDSLLLRNESKRKDIFGRNNFEQALGNLETDLLDIEALPPRLFRLKKTFLIQKFMSDHQKFKWFWSITYQEVLLHFRVLIDICT